MARRNKKYSNVWIIHLVLTLVTYGFWLLVLAVWYVLIPALRKKVAKPRLRASVYDEEYDTDNRNPGEFYSKVAGVSFNNEDGTSRQKIIARFAKPGMPLILVREPHNPHSETGSAVAVFIKAETIFASNIGQIGYLKDGVSREIAKHMDSGKQVKAKISEVTGGGKGRSFGVNIFIQKISP